MDKRTEFNTALKEAMKGGDQVKVATLRLIMAGLKDKDINSRGEGKGEKISDDAILSMLQGMIKQRNESLDTYRKANREDLAGREEAEINIIKSFLPQQMSDAEVGKTVDALIAELGVKDVKDMGKLMGALKTRYAGQMDMAKAGAIVKERIAAAG